MRSGIRRLLLGLGGCWWGGCGGPDATTSSPPVPPVTRGLCAADWGLERPAHWTQATHCPYVDPDYEELFGEGVVRRVDVSVTAADYQAMMDFLEDEYAGGTGDLDALPTPLYVPATVRYGGHEWTHVGFRWKGHASLKGAWSAGVRKLAFTLNFDRFEAQHPELVDQRCFGFERLSFANAYHDPSYLRDKTAAAIYRAAGVPAARSSFAAVYLDRGDGPEYHGLYTLIEDPADHLLDVQLGSHEGHLYKPWGEPARWLSLEQIPRVEVEAYFKKENFEERGDWSDVLAALEALHADRTDPEVWRAGLEAVFDVPAFLAALAVSRVMTNWDSYGCKHHNYLLYADPANEGRLRWLPWDLNEALMEKDWSGCAPTGSVMLDEIVQGEASDPALPIDADWPLIRLLLGDEVYRADYAAAVREVLTEAFDPAVLIPLIRADHALIAPYVVGPLATEVYPFSTQPDPATSFEASLVGGQYALETLIESRPAAVRAQLAAAGFAGE